MAGKGNDFVIRLSVDNKGFITGIKSSNAQLNSFIQTGKNSKATMNVFQNSFNNIGKSLGTFSLYLGIAKGGVDLFQRTINSTKTSAEFFDVSLAKVNTVLDVFFENITTNGLYNFNNDLSTSINLSGQFAR
jgi:hypothetical protein